MDTPASLIISKCVILIFFVLFCFCFKFKTTKPVQYQQYLTLNDLVSIVFFYFDT